MLAAIEEAAMPAKRPRLAKARRGMGFSQEGFARKLGVDRSTVARWEAGETEPQPWVRRRMAELFDVSMHEVERMLATDEPSDDDAEPPSSLHPQTTIVEEEPAVNRREFAVASALAALGLRVGRPATATTAAAHEAAELAQAVPFLARLNDDFGGVDELGHLAVALAERGDRLLQVEELALRASSTLAATVGELWMQAGWLRYDAGDQMSSHAHFSRALQLGQLTDNLDLEVRALAAMSSQATYNRRFLDGVLCAQRARRLIGENAPSRLRSLLHLREAVAYAAQGNAAKADAAMGRARDAYDDRDAQEPDWIYFYTPAEHLAFEGLANAMLGRPARAHGQLLDALGRMTNWRRNSVYYSTVLAQTQVAQRDIHSAYETVERVLPALVQTGSRRARERAEAVCAHAASSPTARSRAFLGLARDAGLRVVTV